MAGGQRKQESERAVTGLDLEGEVPLSRLWAQELGPEPAVALGRVAPSQGDR